MEINKPCEICDALEDEDNILYTEMPASIQDTSSYVKMITITNIKTGEEKSIPENDPIPDGWMIPLKIETTSTPSIHIWFWIFLFLIIIYVIRKHRK